MKATHVFGVLVLLPAALNGATPARAAGMTTLICSSDGLVRSMPLPLPPAREGETGCCAKACHTGSRKRSGCGI